MFITSQPKPLLNCYRQSDYSPGFQHLMERVIKKIQRKTNPHKIILNTIADTHQQQKTDTNYENSYSRNNYRKYSLQSCQNHKFCSFQQNKNSIKQRIQLQSIDNSSIKRKNKDWSVKMKTIGESIDIPLDRSNFPYIFSKLNYQQTRINTESKDILKVSTKGIGSHPYSKKSNQLQRLGKWLTQKKSQINHSNSQSPIFRLSKFQPWHTKERDQEF